MINPNLTLAHSLSAFLFVFNSGRVTSEKEESLLKGFWEETGATISPLPAWNEHVKAQICRSHLRAVRWM